MESFEVNLTCPNCAFASDRVVCVNGEAKPAEGQIYVCTQCGYVSKFDQHLSLVRMPVDELVDVVRQEPNIVQMVMAVHAMNEEGNQS